MGTTFRFSIATLLLSFIVVLAMTYPITRDFAGAVYGYAHDGLDTMWRGWAYSMSPRSAALGHFDFQNFPDGINLKPSIYSSPVSEALLYIFAKLIGQPLVAYNSLFLVKLTLAAFFFAHLLRSLGLKPAVSILCGLVYAFNPAMSSLSKAYGLNFVSSFLPLAVLAGHRFRLAPSPKRFAAMLLAAGLFLGENYYYSFLFLSIGLMTFTLINVFKLIALLAQTVKPQHGYLTMGPWQKRLMGFLAPPMPAENDEDDEESRGNDENAPSQKGKPAARPKSPSRRAGTAKPLMRHTHAAKLLTRRNQTATSTPSHARKTPLALRHAQPATPPSGHLLANAWGIVRKRFPTPAAQAGNDEASRGYAETRIENEGSHLATDGMRILLSFLGCVLSLVLLATWMPGFASTIGRTFPVTEAIRFSSQLRFFLVPALDNPVLGHFFVNYYWKHKGIRDSFELSQYLGISLLLLFLRGLFSWPMQERPMRRLLATVALGWVMAVIFSLGPRIPLGIHPSDAYDLAAVPGPAALFFQAAPMFRFISRAQVICYFFLIIGAAIGLNSCLDSLSSAKQRAAALILVAAFFIVEYASPSAANVTFITKAMPKAYHKLAAMPGHFPILETPMEWYRTRLHFRTFQVLHQKKLATDFEKPAGLNMFSTEDQKTALDQGFRYWVVIKTMPRTTLQPLSPKQEEEGMSEFAAPERLGYLQRVGDYDDSTLYKLEDEFPRDAAFVRIGAGFWDQHDKESLSKWTRALKSDLILSVPRGVKNLSLSFEATSLKPKTLGLRVNGLAREYSVGPGRKDHFVVRIPVKAGVNRIELDCGGGLDNIAKVLNVGDPRDVCIFIGNFKLSTQ